MKYYILSTALTFYSTMVFAEATQLDPSVLELEAQNKVQQFGKQLKTQLKAGLKAGGFAQGIQVCHDVAEDIAQQHSTQGWTVARTSLKVRNSTNQPDAWESKQLMLFEKMRFAGKPIQEMSASAIVTLDNGDEIYRYMKPIPTGALCLSCHGKNLEQEIQTKIQTLYPNDKATGFNVGDIRGAFSLIKQQ